jgi:hypothetical protein
MGMTAIPMIRLGIKCDDSSQCKHLLTCLLLRVPLATPQKNKAMAERDEEMSKGRNLCFSLEPKKNPKLKQREQ